MRCSMPALTVKSIQWKRSAAAYTVYNLLVQDDHTYFVGNGQEWVHNGPGDCPPKSDWVKDARTFLSWAEQYIEKPQLVLNQEAADQLVAEARSYGLDVYADAKDLAGHPETNWPIPHIHIEPNRIRLHIAVPPGYVIPPL